MLKYNSIDTVVEEVIDWGDYKGQIDRVAIKKWANSLLRKMDVPTHYVDKIAMLEVKDHKAILPEDMSSVVQMAFKDSSPRKVRRMEIVEWTQQHSGCELKITKECPKCHNDDAGDCSCKEPEIIYEVDRQFLLNHPELQYQHMKHYYRHGGLVGDNQVVSPYHPEFTLMKPSTHVFFNADQHIPGCLNLNHKLMSNCNTEYKLDFPIVNVNKEQGNILIAYLAERMDEDGYKMIPDIEDVYEALKWYVIEAMEYRSIGKSLTQQDKNHHRQMTVYAKQEKVEAMGRANEILNTPNFKDWIGFLENNYFKVFTDQHVSDQIGVKTPDVYAQQMSRLTKHR